MKVIQDIRPPAPKDKVLREENLFFQGNQKKRYFSVWVKFVLFIFLFAGLAGGTFAFGVLSAGQEVLNCEEYPSSSFIQFKNLILSKNRPLKGEEDGRVNILFLGKGGEGHPGGGLTDTILLVSIQPQTKRMAMISIPRDLYIKVSEAGYYIRINAVEQFGENYYGSKEEGISLLRKTISEITGVPIHYYAQLDFSGFIEIIDKLGGIEIDIEEDINDPLFPGPRYTYEPFSLKAGKYNLDGETALKFVRTRHSLRGDFDRIQRQQKVLIAIKNKVFEGNIVQNIFSFNNILKGLKGHLDTDIQLGEAKRFLDIAGDIDNYKIINKVLDNNPKDGVLKSGGIKGISVLLPRRDDFKEIQEFCRNIFELSTVKH